MLRQISDIIQRQFKYFLNIIAIVIGYLFYPSQRGYLPAIKNDLLLQPGIKLAEKIKTGKLKSENLIKAFIERCKEINDDLNAIVDDNFEEALKQARLVDERVQKELNGEPSPDGKSINDFPYLGVPFTAKNTLAAKDKTYSSGCYIRKDIVATEDCHVVNRMKTKGGAIFLAVTNIPELAFFYDSFNRVDGQTNNPYDKSRIPGGSSGGEGSLVSAAGSVVGIGNDIGGSIRIPSHYCGIFGHYTTPGVVPIGDIFPTQTDIRRKMLSTGPMCRYACDIRPTLKLLVDDDSQIDLSEKPLNYSELNVYYLRQLNDPMTSPVDLEIQQGLDKVIKYFIDKGARTIELNQREEDVNSFYDLRYAIALWSTAMHDPKSPTIQEQITDNGNLNQYWELLKCMFGVNQRHTSGLMILSIGMDTFMNKLGTNPEYRKMLERLRNNLHQLLGRNGILICPTLPEIAPKHNQTLLKMTDTNYTTIWNTMNVAMTTVPMGLERHGMPYGLTLVVSPMNDNLSITVAEDLEKQFGGWVPPSNVRLDLNG